MRAVLRVYGAVYLLLGVWQALAPASFAAQPFADFPPFNAHFVRDISSYYLAAGIVLLLVAQDAQPSRHRLVLTLVLAQSGFHTLNHLYDSTIGQGPTWHLLTDTLPLFVATCLLAVLLFRHGTPEDAKQIGPVGRR